MRFISKTLLKNINSLENAENEYDKLLDRSDVKKLFKSGRTVINSYVNTIRGFFKDLEYIKLDIATGREDIPELETEEQGGGRLKIMTPNQLLTWLPFLLAQKQAGSNSQKLNNEIRQIIYSYKQIIYLL